MWKGELAPCDVCVEPELQFGKGAHRTLKNGEERLARPFLNFLQGPDSNWMGTLWVSFMVKLLRAYGGCLGANRR
jgi:hypothetical protein